MNRRYQIQATVTRTFLGASTTKQLPTFYLHKDVQGIMSENHARRIAVDVIDPFGYYLSDPNFVSINITATECE